MVLPFLPCQEFHKRRIRYIVQIHPIDVWKFCAQLGQERIQVNGGLGHGSLFPEARRTNKYYAFDWEKQEKKNEMKCGQCSTLFMVTAKRENNNGRFAKK